MKIGFACKIVDPVQNKIWVENHNFKSTTVAFMNRQTPVDQRKKLASILTHNLYALKNMLVYVSNLPPSLRMMRIGSDLLPLYTHSDFEWFYKIQDNRDLIEQQLKIAGDFARLNGIRLSFHPGQFCILNSTRSDVVDKTIIELEYHTFCTEMMGFDGSQFHDHNFAINIHVGGKEGGTGSFLANSKRLSQSCRNFLTVENDEFSFGVDDVLKVADEYPIVLDIHHNLIHSGEYITPDDKRMKTIIDSWRGNRPKIHFSTSIEAISTHTGISTLPNVNKLLTEGYNKTMLRKHSDMCWNDAINTWALSFLPIADIMVEAKNKNLASKHLFESMKNVVI